eukprot:34522-Eustigmatos_ZCMA.PRE.1
MTGAIICKTSALLMWYTHNAIVCLSVSLPRHQVAVRNPPISTVRYASFNLDANQSLCGCGDSITIQ